MSALWRKLSSEVSSSFLAALLLCAGFWGFVAWDQSHWWRVKADYSFGWLVPAFVIFAIHDRWSRIVGAAAACAAGSVNPLAATRPAQAKSERRKVRFMEI